MQKFGLGVFSSVVACMVALCASSTQAASLRISPTTVEFEMAQNSQTLTVFNQSSESTTLQARAFKWTQENGKDILVPTTDLVISPPVTHLAASSSYNYRIVHLDKKPITGEKSYRLILDEIPKPIDSRKLSQGLTVLMRISLPVFITNPNSQLKLAWTIEQYADKSVLTVTNQGGIRTLLTDVKLVDATTNKEYPLQIGTVNGYVLAGSQKSYPIRNDFIFDPSRQYYLQLVVNGKETRL
ncbi:fimbrial biogenesis chaperone [Acinetobacter rathckeae]|uniref:fimbrial biogenesis chaperone n=1 Tax=Acinetobacter rathckeae TaxID=2605272 RepID=UPI0018A2A6ED|nr:fimbria/pilus periplasmic chaperone [Acinetobacter rathckeae]MBF7686712.1 molecular chaperone [Acinetobacter rathckeae]MBF7695755.1 molecular chaperone [Acinetobacter rathckeae]